MFHDYMLREYQPEFIITYDLLGDELVLCRLGGARSGARSKQNGDRVAPVPIGESVPIGLGQNGLDPVQAKVPASSS